MKFVPFTFGDYTLYISFQIQYNLIPSVFYEDSETNTFGRKVYKKNCSIAIQQPVSDFRFDLTTKVVATNPSASGFIIDLYPEKRPDEPQSTPL